MNTTTPQPNDAQKRAGLLFLPSPLEHVCCDCCAGYCPLDEVPEEWPDMLRLALGGVEYHGTRYMMVRADAADATGHIDHTLGATAPVLAWATIPDEVPPLTGGRAAAWAWERCHLAGIDLRADPGATVLHLYLADRHVGWVRGSPRGVTREQWRTARIVADEAGISIDAAAAAVRITTQAQLAQFEGSNE